MGFSIIFNLQVCTCKYTQWHRMRNGRISFMDIYRTVIFFFFKLCAKRFFETTFSWKKRTQETRLTDQKVWFYFVHRYVFACVEIYMRSSIRFILNGKKGTCLTFSRIAIVEGFFLVHNKQKKYSYPFYKQWSTWGWGGLEDGVPLLIFLKFKRTSITFLSVSHGWWIYLFELSSECTKYYTSQFMLLIISI